MKSTPYPLLCVIVTCEQNVALLEPLLASMDNRLAYATAKDSGRYEFAAFDAMLQHVDDAEYFLLMHDSAIFEPGHFDKLMEQVSLARERNADLLWFGPGTCNLALVRSDYVIANAQAILQRTSGLSKKDAVNLECSGYLAKLAQNPLQVSGEDTGYEGVPVHLGNALRFKRLFRKVGITKFSLARKWEEIQDYRVYVMHCPRTCEDRREPLQTALLNNRLASQWITDFDAQDITLPAGAGCKINEYSLWLKHRLAFQRGGPALILEDDAILCENFRPRLEAVLADCGNDCDFVSFASATWPCRTRPRSALTEWAGALNTTVAYWASARACAAFASWENPPAPVDWWLAGGITIKEMRVAWAKPPLVDNGSLTGNYKCQLHNK